MISKHIGPILLCAMVLAGLLGSVLFVGMFGALALGVAATDIEDGT